MANADLRSVVEEVAKVRWWIRAVMDSRDALPASDWKARRVIELLNEFVNRGGTGSPTTRWFADIEGTIRGYWRAATDDGAVPAAIAEPLKELPNACIRGRAALAGLEPQTKYHPSRKRRLRE